MQRQFAAMAPTLLAIYLTACGGGGGGGGGIAGGGTSGSGTGTVSGFGSVIINDIREFQINSSTVVTLDDNPATQSDLKVGMVVNYRIGSDVNTTLTTGTATRIEASHPIKGPVTGLNPLRVMGRAVTVNGNTLLDNLSSANSLVVGDLLEVSGFSDGNDALQATLLERKSSIAQWRVTGTVSNLVPNDRFSIGTLTVRLNGLIPANCGSGIQNGSSVIVKAQPDVDVAAGGSLDTVLSVACVTGGLSTSNDNSATIRAAIEGLIATIDTGARSLSIDGQTVRYTAATVFQDGVEADLGIGVKIEAEGSMSAGVLNATRIRIRQTQVRIEAPIDDASVSVGQAKTLIGIPVQITAATRVDAISGQRQVELKGFVDRTGTVYASEWRDKGTANANDIRLKGPASNPVANSRFNILGATINTTTAGTITPDVTTLFNAIGAGTAQVEVEHGQLTPPSTINNADIRLR